MDMRSDGSYFTSGAANATAGSWHVEDGHIVVLITNVSGRVYGKDSPSRCKIVSIDDHQMTFVVEGKKNVVAITKITKP